MYYSDIIRKFYANFGVADEIPPKDLDINHIVSEIDDIESEFLILKKTLKNDKILNHFNICSELIDSIANELSENALFIKELELVSDKINLDIEAISNGIIWFQQAQETDPRNLKNTKIEPVNGIDINSIIGLKIQGSLILRLYIGLVYMREGPVNEILKIGFENNCKIMSYCFKLFKSDYIRHIRNSLSHGTFSINIAGVHFKDRDYEIVCTPGFLDKICIWLFIFYYQCILFAQNKFE